MAAKARPYIRPSFFIAFVQPGLVSPGFSPAIADATADHGAELQTVPIAA
jgi:hypothetical protein